MIAAPPMLFGLAIQMDAQITLHFDMHATLWHRHVTTVLVDQGGPYLVPHRFEAWFREGLHGFEGLPDTHGGGPILAAACRVWRLGDRPRPTAGVAVPGTI